MREYVLSLHLDEVKGFRFSLEEKNPLAVDLLRRMLCFDPAQRITVAEALRHPYLAQLHDESREPLAPGIFRFDFKDEDVHEENIRSFVLEEIMRYKLQQQDDAAAAAATAAAAAAAASTTAAAVAAASSNVASATTDARSGAPVPASA